MQAVTAFAENLVWVRSLLVCFLYTTNPTPRKITCCGKKCAPHADDYLNFCLGWVGLGLGEFVAFVIPFTWHTSMFSDPT